MHASLLARTHVTVFHIDNGFANQFSTIIATLRGHAKLVSMVRSLFAVMNSTATSLIMNHHQFITPYIVFIYKVYHGDVRYLGGPPCLDSAPDPMDAAAVM